MLPNDGPANLYIANNFVATTTEYVVATIPFPIMNSGCIELIRYDLCLSQLVVQRPFCYINHIFIHG